MYDQTLSRRWRTQLFVHGILRWIRFFDDFI